MRGYLDMDSLEKKGLLDEIQEIRAMLEQLKQPVSKIGNPLSSKRVLYLF